MLHQIAIYVIVCYYCIMIEIDEVRLALQTPVTESGDYISDEYLNLIDVSTSPDPRTQSTGHFISQSMRRLNRNLETTSTILVGTELADVYDSVVGQLNSLNSDIPERHLLKPLIRDDSRFQGNSGKINWGPF